MNDISRYKNALVVKKEYLEKECYNNDDINDSYDFTDNQSSIHDEKRINRNDSNSRSSSMETFI